MVRPEVYWLVLDISHSSRLHSKSVSNSISNLHLSVTHHALGLKVYILCFWNLYILHILYVKKGETVNAIELTTIEEIFVK